jgi:putative membrane protein
MTEKMSTTPSDSADRQETPIKAAVVIEQKATKFETELSLKSAVAIYEDEKWQDLPDLQSQKVEDETQVESNQKPRFSRWFAYLSSAVLILTVTEVVLFIAELYQRQDWLAALWLVLSIGLLGFIAAAGLSEWRGLRQLKRQEAMRQSSRQLYDTPAIGLGKMHCQTIAANLPQQYERDVIVWQSALAEHHTDSEVLSLFEHSVIAKVDEKALSTITANAGAASVLIAVSPFALLDMAIVLWRNLRMLNQISEAYGVRLGYWGRISLIRRIFHTMLYAGAAEIISDAGNYALGAGVTGKLSSRVAQGMGAGVLSARIGLKAMQECRPMPWLSVEKPGLADISKQLLSDLNKRVR